VVSSTADRTVPQQHPHTHPLRRHPAAMTCRFLARAQSLLCTCLYLNNRKGGAGLVSWQVLGDGREVGRILHPLAVTFGHLELSLSVQPLLVEGATRTRSCQRREQEG
jgi:hypothetical protein